MPVFRTEDAQPAGWKQTREATVAFEGDVIGTVIDSWGGTALGDDGRPLPPSEYFEIKCANTHILEVSEPLEMDVEGKEFSFRLNTNPSENSFWVSMFIESAERNGILLPDGLAGKRIEFRKKTMEWNLKDGGSRSKTDFVIERVIGQATPIQVTPAPQGATVATPPPLATSPAPDNGDVMVTVMELADGKTEAQFVSAASLHPFFQDSPFLALAKAGALTSTLVKEGKLTLVEQGGSQVYKKV